MCRCSAKSAAQQGGVLMAQSAAVAAVHVSKLRTSLWRARRAFANTMRDIIKHDYLTRSAALAFYFMMSVFPLLVFLASALAWIPIPNLFNEIIIILAVLMPPAASELVRGVLNDVLRTNTSLLSIGILGAVLAS